MAEQRYKHSSKTILCLLRDTQSTLSQLPEIFNKCLSKGWTVNVSFLSITFHFLVFAHSNPKTDTLSSAFPLSSVRQARATSLDYKRAWTEDFWSKTNLPNRRMAFLLFFQFFSLKKKKKVWYFFRLFKNFNQISVEPVNFWNW